MVKWLMDILLTIIFCNVLEGKMLVDNAMDFNHIFNEALSSKLQKAKTQRCRLAL